MMNVLRSCRLQPECAIGLEPTDASRHTSDRSKNDGVLGAALFRKQQCEIKPQLPLSPIIRVSNIVKSLDRCAVGLPTDPEDTAEAAAQRHRPLLARTRRPVRGDYGRRNQIPSVPVRYV